MTLHLRLIDARGADAAPYRRNAGVARVARTMIRCVLLSAVLHGGPAWGEGIGVCQTGSLAELKSAMYAHNQHIYRLNRKFKDIWYYQGAVPAGVGSEVTLAGLHRYLDQLAPRRAAILFHAFEQDRLCTWLISPGGGTLSHVQQVKDVKLAAIVPARWQDLAITTARTARTAERRPAPPEVDPDDNLRRWDEVLRAIGKIVLPSSVGQQLINDNIDTLIVVPISVRSFVYGREEENDGATALREEKGFSELLPTMQLVLSLSTMPYLALPLGEGQVIDRMSVVVAPGFFPFGQPPRPARGPIREPLVVGSPVRSDLQYLPGAHQEAVDVARILKTTAYTDQDAKKAVLLDKLAQRAASIDFILLATHGRASARNPVDGSYLEFSDGRLDAREIALRLTALPEKDAKVKIGALKSHPLVVMSACETGLGKDFAVGTIGLARAWHWAGADDVVMILWSVDDLAARDLMVNFVRELAKGEAVDKALREAAYLSRLVDRNPARWASFNVFGAPALRSAH